MKKTKNTIFFLCLFFALLCCDNSVLIIPQKEKILPLTVPEMVYPVVIVPEEADLITAQTFYVDGGNINAADLNPGTELLPWKTIQNAVNKVNAGSKIIVNSGVYNERIKINKSGSSGNYIIIEASGNVYTKGFEIYGSFIAITGFNITGDDTYISWLGSGIWIDGSNIYIAGNKISGFTSTAGIHAGWSDYLSNQYIHIKDNYIYQCNKGIVIMGTDWIVENNEIERLYRGPNGGDADNFRFFGKNIIIRKNIMHGTLLSEIGQSHVDLFQTYDNNGEIAQNILFEKNIGVGLFHQGLMAEGTNDSHRNIIFKNNVFVNSGSWGFCIYGLYGIHIINNTLFNIQYFGIGLQSESLNYNRSAGTVKNNIFAYCRTTYFSNEDCAISSGYNVLFNYIHSPNISSTDLVNINPLFNIGLRSNDLTIDDILGPDGIAFTSDDGLNIQSGSPAVGTGENGSNIGAY